MSRTLLALVVKFGLTLLAAAVAFRYFEMNEWSLVLLLAAVGTVLNYIIGDLGILPAAGNIVASIADGGLAAVVAYALGWYTERFEVSWTSLAVFGGIVAVGEYFFHRYLVEDRKVAP